jgi:hypothetical protein
MGARNKKCEVERYRPDARIRRKQNRAKGGDILAQHNVLCKFH